MLDPTLAGALAGAVTGGIAGAAANHLFSRPRPSVWILGCFLDPMQPDDKRAIAEEILHGRAQDYFVTPANVYDCIEQNDYIGLLERFYQHPAQYTFALYEMNRDNEVVRLLHREMPRVVTLLRTQLNTQLLPEFLTTWAQYSMTLMGQLKAAHVRSNFDIGKTSLAKPDDRPIHAISTDGDGDFFVNIGRLRIPCVWSTDKVQATRLKGFMERIALALAYEDRTILHELVARVGQVNWNDPSLVDTADTIAAELARFDRVVVRGVLSNRGRTPVAVDGICTLEIASEGFASSGTVVQGALRVEMHCVDDGKLRARASLEIGPGSATPFVAVSRQHLYQLEKGEAVRALHGSERTARLIVRRLDSRKWLSSAKVPFRRREL
jgi:hypothetical protein